MPFGVFEPACSTRQTIHLQYAPMRLIEMPLLSLVVRNRFYSPVLEASGRAPKRRARVEVRGFLTGILKLLAILSLASCGDGGGGGGAPTEDDLLHEVASVPRRSVDGTGNNLQEPSWGVAHSQLLRLTPVGYEDGVSRPAGQSRPSPRLISVRVCAQGEGVFNSKGASDFVWQWGQFLDHDIDLTGTADPLEAFDIRVPAGDPYFDPHGTGSAVIELNRSEYDRATGTDTDNPRQQINQITAFIDASNVYGSDDTRAAALRTNDGTGRLRTSSGDLLPFNTDGLPNAPDNGSSYFLAGDVRSNEQVGLTAMHTLFVREHNRLATRIREMEAGLSGDEIYARARAVVGAEMQVITYNEFLPVLLGPNALSAYEGYDPSVNASIANVFSAASYRLGHSMLSPRLMRLGSDGLPIAQGHLALRDAFFSPQRIVEEGGIEPLLRGLATQSMQEVDLQVIDDVRNFLFGPPGAGGFDLVSLNIQRGRDHGLADYNRVRLAFGLDPVTSFSEISSVPAVREKLEELYGSVDDIDVWVGGLAEDHFGDAMVGELIFTVLKDQFERLRDGDRFWYENVFSQRSIEVLEATKLSDVVRRNTAIAGEIPDDVFLAR